MYVRDSTWYLDQTSVLLLEIKFHIGKKRDYPNTNLAHPPPEKLFCAYGDNKIFIKKYQCFVINDEIIDLIAINTKKNCFVASCKLPYWELKNNVPGASSETRK